MAGINVGSVSVEVVPSAKTFASTLRAQLSPVGDQIGRELGQRISGQISDSIGRGITDGAARSRASSARAGDSSGGAFADAFKARVAAALRDLPKPKVGVDATEADAELADIREKLRALGDVRVGVDLRAEDALAELDGLKARLDALGASSPDVQVRADTARASAELAAVQAEVDKLATDSPTVRVDADTAAAQGKLAALQAQMAGLGGGGLGLLGGSALLFGPTAGAGLLGGLGAVPAGLTGILGAAGALKLGLGGVGTALSDVTKAQQAAGQSAAQTAARIGSADASIASAKRSLANARRSASQTAVAAAEAVSKAQEQLGVTEEQVASARQQAARRVSDAETNLASVEQNAALGRAQAAQTVQNAEYSLAQANRQAADAQTALNDARETALRQLQDMANQAADAALQVQADQFALQDAQAAQQQIDASATATAEDKAKAALAVAQAQQRLAEAQLAAQRATEDNTAAQAAGVDGSAQVKAATQGVADAQHNQAQASQALADAQAAQVRQQQQSTAQILAAQRQVTDAQAAQVKAEKDGARQIADAVRSVADAHRAEANSAANSAASIAGAQASLANAERQRGQAAAATSTAARKAAADMAALGPAGRAFVGFLQSLQPTLDKLKTTARDNLLPGLTAAIKDVLPAAPAYNAFIGAAAKGIGAFADGLARIAATPAAQTVLKSSAGFMKDLGDATLHVLDAFTQIGAAFSPLVSKLGGGIDGLAKRFDGWASGLTNNPGFQKFLDYVETNGPKLVDTLGKVGGAVISIAKALAPFSQAMLPAVGAIADMVKAHPDIALAALAMFKFSGAIGGVVGGLRDMGNLPGIIKGTETAVSGFGKVAGLIFSPEGAILAGVVALGVGAYELYKHWDTVTAWFTGPFVDFFKGAWKKVEGFFTDAVDWVKDEWSKHWQLILGIVTGPIGLAVGEIVAHWSDITGAFSDAWDWVKGTWSFIWHGVVDVLTAPFTGAWGLIKGVWDNITGAFNDAWTFVHKNWGTIWAGIENVLTAPFRLARDALSDIWGDIKGAMSNLWDDVKGIFVAGVRDVLNGLNFFIDKIDDVLGFFHLPKIPDIPLPPLPSHNGGAKPGGGGGGTPPRAEADGGVMPGYAPGVDSILAMLSPGEGILRPEVVRWLGPATIGGWNAAAKSGGLPHFADGGILGSIGSAIGSIGSDIRHVLGKGVGAAVSAAEAPARAALDALPDTFLRSIALGVLSRLHDGAVSLISGAQHAQSSGGSGGAVSGLAALGKAMAAGWGWTGAEWQAMFRQIQFESGWNNTAQNPTSTAFGLGQFLDSTWAGVGLSKTSDPVTQLIGYHRYVTQRYGDPIASWAFENAHGYYDQGGMLQPGLTLAYNGTGAPEPVLTSHQWDTINRATVGGDGMSVDLSPVVDEIAALRREVHRVPAEQDRLARRQPVRAR